jgi:hypothetical protein
MAVGEADLIVVLKQTTETDIAHPIEILGHATQRWLYIVA